MLRGAEKRADLLYGVERNGVVEVDEPGAGHGPRKGLPERSGGLSIQRRGRAKPALAEVIGEEEKHGPGTGVRAVEQLRIKAVQETEWPRDWLR